MAVRSALQAISASSVVRTARRNDGPNPPRHSEAAHLDELKNDNTKTYPIVLTHHGGDAWFRNMRIRELR